MDGYQVHDVARFPSVGGGGCPVCRKVDGVQHVTEKFIRCVRKKRKALSPSKSPTIGMSPGAAPLLRVSSGSAARKNVPGGIGGPRYCLIALSVAVEITHQWNVARKAPRLSVPIASAARENVPGESGGPPHAISLFPSPLKSAQTGSVRTKRLIAASRTALTRGITACMARMRS
jgi:hypothetical protein